MSGIMGIFYLDGRPVDHESLGRMVDTLAHRGPDGVDIWSEGSVGFGHRMLWTTPESLLEKLPLVNQTGDLVITADARIDNRDELIAALGFNDRPAEKITDSQLILAAYEKWGESCPEHLLGDFAFAIWDGRQQVLFCARDHFGVKPFYYHYKPGHTFIFASEIKAILCLPDVPRRLNEVRIAEYLASTLEDKAITSYQAILRLPPAQTMTVSYGGGIQLRSYWSLDPSHELQLNSDEDYAEAFREVFTEAVRCRLRSAFPVGSHLSGGLDSSSVTCVARELLAQQGRSQLHTFSNIFDDVPECDERSFIEPILAQGGLIPHYVRPDRIGPLSEWKELLQPEEEPSLFGANGFLVWGLNRATQEAGVRISLDGFDGDTTVGHGMGYFAELACQGEWATFAAEATGICQHFNNSPAYILRNYGFTYLEELAKQGRWLAFAKTVKGIDGHFKVSPKQLWLHLGLKPLVPQPILQVWRSLRGRKQPQNSVLSLINCSFADRMGVQDPVKVLEPAQSSLLTAAQEQWLTFTSGRFTLVLEQCDLAAATFSIESRHPFMDKRLIEFCLSLPASQKLHQGWTRMVMRRAMNGILPEPVRWRGGKANMTANFLHGLLNFNRELLDEIVLSNPESIAAYVDLNVLQMSYDRIVSGGNLQNADIGIVWSAVALALWLNHSGMTP
ncbi:MAG: lasso peptide isopeptide bond-forming cyclase [Coleofasciculus sp. S288]|nr:lasso peptide isopeptide bond-forming cyclase [Coleofasciculus sp. S288]